MIISQSTHPTWMLTQTTYPPVRLKRFPTPGELEHLRKYMKQYMSDHPEAKKWDLTRALENEFNKKFLIKPKSKSRLNEALTRRT